MFFEVKCVCLGGSSHWDTAMVRRSAEHSGRKLNRGRGSVPLGAAHTMETTGIM